MRLTADRDLRKASGSWMHATCAGREFHILGSVDIKVWLYDIVEERGMRNLVGAPLVVTVVGAYEKI